MTISLAKCGQTSCRSESTDITMPPLYVCVIPFRLYIIYDLHYTPGASMSLRFRCAFLAIGQCIQVEVLLKTTHSEAMGWSPESDVLFMIELSPSSNSVDFLYIKDVLFIAALCTQCFFIAS